MKRNHGLVRYYCKACGRRFHGRLRCRCGSVCRFKSKVGAKWCPFTVETRIWRDQHRCWTLR